jgi:hypothetical protein
MPSPTKAHQQYTNSKGVRLPGVTTVIGLLDKPALIRWAYNLGRAGEDMYKTKDLAADMGTCTHYLLECFLIGEEPDLDHFTPFCQREAGRLFANFKKWHKRQGEMETLGSEIQMVSENWQFGGTIDWVARHYGETTLFDFKTSTGIYLEARLQMAAYWAMWDENHPEDPIQKVIIIHLDKRTYQVTPHPFDEMGLEWDMFKLLRSLYQVKKQLDGKDKATRAAEKPRKLARAGKTRQEKGKS